MSGTIYLDKSDIVTMIGNEFAKKMAVVLTDKLTTELMTCYDVVATGRYPYTGRFGDVYKRQAQSMMSFQRL